jgi:DNA-binding protein YbaB
VSVRRSELVSLDVLGSDEQLRAATRNTPADRPADPHADMQGQDPAGAVTVRATVQGQVLDVLISTWWRDNLTPSQLPDAVLAAYRQAITRAAAHMTPPPTVARPQAQAAPLPDEPDDDAAWFDDVRRRLDRTGETLDRSRRLLDARVAVERVVSGPAGLVRLVVVTGTTVARVEINPQAALRETANRLSADALAAFQALN